MKKILSIIIVFAVLALIGTVALFVKNYVAKEDGPVPARDENKKQEIAATTQKYHEENTPLNYTVSLEYPQFSGMANEKAQQLINGDLKDSSLEVIAEFKRQASSCAGENMPSCEFEGGFQEFTVVGGILSVNLYYYTYTGGAHGSTAIVFKNYNRETGKEFDWKSVFTKDSGYETIIADYAQQQLRDREQDGYKIISDRQWLADGTKPGNDNYNANVGFDKEGLVVVYQQYQVTFFAAGPQTVVIPYSKLKAVMNPGGPLPF